MKSQVIRALIIYLCLQSCASYEKTSVRLEQAVDKGKILIILEDGKEKNFDSVVFKDSAYYGVMSKSTNKSQYQLISIDGSSPVFLSKPKASKNVLHTSFSGYIMTGGGLSLNYERKIDKSFWLSAGVGGFPLAGDGAKMMNLKIIHLTGKRSSHLELGVGITAAYSKGEEELVTVFAGTIPEVPPHWEAHPAITLGYRYQRPRGGPVLRFGVGYYEIYAGLGFRF
jgi:hypothetical protein